jgi:hypothetical protein
MPRWQPPRRPDPGATKLSSYMVAKQGPNKIPEFDQAQRRQEEEQINFRVLRKN